MRLCAAGFTSSQRNPRYCETVVGRSILTKRRRAGDEIMKNITIHRMCKPAMIYLAAGACLLVYNVAGVAQTPKPKRINRAIELLDQGQPVYYTGSHSGTV